MFDAALRRPWAVALALVWPPLKLWTVAKAFLAMALLPPASGAAVITALIAWIPNQLADVDEGFHRLGLHYSAFVYGPLIFAAAQGAARWSELLGPSGRRRLHAWILVAAGTQLLMNSDFLIALMPSRWKGTVPRALSHIPKDAKLWADDFLLPHVGMRRHLKSLPRDFPYPLFEGGLFEPDRVLMSLHWAERADRRARDAVIGALRGSGYRVVFQEGDLLVWSRPESPPPASRRTRGPSARSRSRS